jgi:hypothetical protein
MEKKISSPVWVVSGIKVLSAGCGTFSATACAAKKAGATSKNKEVYSKKYCLKNLL